MFSAAVAFCGSAGRGGRRAKERLGERLVHRRDDDVQRLHLLARVGRADVQAAGARDAAGWTVFDGRVVGAGIWVERSGGPVNGRLRVAGGNLRASGV